MGIGNGIGISWGKVAMASGPVINEAFEFTVKTDNAGPSADNQFTIPITSATPYNISTSDGQSITGATGATTLTFPSAGTYTIKITESCNGWRFANGGDRLKLLDISNWGVYNQYASEAFRGASNMTCSAIDAPINPPTEMWRTFYDCTNFNGAIGNWDVSQVARFSQAFFNASSFNQPLDNWDVSSSTSFGYMFANATSFNQPLNSWNVSNTTDFSVMFSGASSFNQPLDNWNTSSATNMGSMFASTPFNQDISGWDVSSVTNFGGMFDRNLVFNQPIGGWNVSSATNMGRMFHSEYAGRNAFNQLIGSWNVSNVTNMEGMFNSSSFDQDISSWNVSSVTNMQNMFRNSLFNKPLNSWNTSAVTRMDGMFYSNNEFNQPLNNWNTSAVTRMYEMLMAARGFDQDISSWDINQVTNFINFGGYAGFSMTFSTANYDALLVAWEAQVPQNNISITFGKSKYSLGSAAEAAKTSLINTYGWTITDGGGIAFPFEFTVDTTQAGTSNSDQFTIPITSSTPYNITTSDGQSITGAVGATTLTFPSAGTYTVSIIGSCNGWRFDNGGDRLKMLNISNWGVYANSTYGAFRGCSNMTCSATDIPIGNHTRMTNAFYGCINFNGAIGNWDVSNVTLMDGVFGFTPFNQDLSNWDVSNVTKMSTMFINATSFNQNINSWNVSSVTDMNQMFSGATSFNSELYSWDVGSVQRMDNMFSSATSFNQDISAWDISSSNMSRMFYRASSFNQPLNSWNVSNVTNMGEMFLSTPFNQPLNSWDVSNVTNMGGMFRGTVFDQDISSWNVSNVSNFLSFMRGHGAPYVNLDMSGWVFRSAGVDLEEMFAYPDTGAIGSAWPKGLDTWTTTGAIDMHLMFGASKLTGPLDVSGWNTSSVTRMSNMFWNYGASYAFTLTGLSSWNISSLTTASAFLGNSFNALSTAEYNALLVAWEAQAPSNAVNIHFGNAQYTLGSAGETARTSLINIYGWTITDGGGIANPNFEFTVNTSVTGAGSTVNTQFKLPLVSTSTVNATVDWGDGTVNTVTVYDDPNATHTYSSPGSYDISISGVLNGWSFNGTGDKRKMVNISNWGCFDWTEGSDVFNRCDLMTQTATDAPTISTTSMVWAFGNTNNWNGVVDHWDMSGVTNITAMFRAARAFNQPVNSWDTSSFTNTSFAFMDADVFNQPLNNWDMSNVTLGQQMFSGADLFNQDLSSWNISSVLSNNFQGLLTRASSFNSPLNWSVINFISVYQFLLEATSFDQSLAAWDISKITSGNNSFMTGGGFVTPANYEATLVSWEAQAPPINKTWNFGNSQYTIGSAGETARTSLINTYGWTIIDGGGIAPPPPPPPSGYETDLVASYNFDADFTDYTGNHNATSTGTVSAGVLGGVVSNASEFDGSTGYLTVADSDDFSMTDGVSDVPFSVSCWVNYDQAPSSGSKWILSKWGPSGSEWTLVRTSASTLVFAISDGTDQIRVEKTLSFSIGTWYNYVITYDGLGLASGIKFYINGVNGNFPSSTLGTYNGTSNTSQDLIIGTEDGNLAKTLDGKIDELHIWKNRELTAAEVTDIYNTELAGNSILPALPLLNTYTGAAAAYSLRDLSSSTTNVVRVRRSSDNTEQDFTSTQVTDGALETFVGAGNDGFVTVWYDQSGNSRNAEQTNTSLQPVIVSSGSLVLLNGMPAIDTEKTLGTNSKYLQTDPGSPFYAVDDASIVFVGAQKPGEGSFGAFVNMDYINNFSIHRNSTQQAVAGGFRIQSATINRPITDNTQYQISLYRDASTGVNSLGINSFTPGTNILPTATTVANNLLIGQADTLDQTDVRKLIQEVVLWENNYITTKSGIETNINDYYTIY